MPRQADPDLEERILKSAQVLWKKGGEEALTMRAVARAAKTNTPAVYRRFKDRQDLVRGLLRRIGQQIGKHFEACESIEDMAEAYIDQALGLPHEYELRRARGVRGRSASREETSRWWKNYSRRNWAARRKITHNWR